MNARLARTPSDADGRSNAGAWPTAVAGGFALLFLAKLWLAATVEPLVDEAFYWQCGARPAIAYVDHPPLTALLVRAGVELFGHSTLGVRAFFLIASALFPWLVFALARRLAGRRDAWLAAGGTLVVPGTAYLGLIAIPDVWILTLTAVFVLALERATSGSRSAWLLAGLAGALGLSTHYRFSVECACGLVFLVATRAGRAQWKHAGPWTAVAIAALGFSPALIVNLHEGFEPLRYYFEGRHDSQIDPEGWVRFIGQQLGIAGPLMLPAFAITFVHVVRRARRGDDRAQLMACFAVLPIALFFVASAWESSALPTLHWPVPAYVPLFAYLPSALREFAARGGAWRRAFVRLAPASGVLVVGFMLYELGSPRPFTELRFRHFSGAREVAARVDAMLAGSSKKPLLVVDNYEFGSRVAFYVQSDVDLYVLDHKSNRHHGRAHQYDLWHMSERDLAQRAGEDALVVMERGSDLKHSRWAAHVASLFEELELVDEHARANPRDAGDLRRVRLFRGSRIRGDTGG